MSVIVSLGPDDQNNPSFDRTDRNEPILHLRMDLVENLEVGPFRVELLPSFLEGNTVLLLVGGVLRFIPLDHRSAFYADSRLSQ